MFELAVIRKHGDGLTSIDAGLLAETMLFYDNVHIVADRGMFSELLKNIGPNNLLELLEEKIANITFQRNFYGTRTVRNNAIASHKFSSITIRAHNQKRINNYQAFEESVYHALGRSTENKKLALKLYDKIMVSNSLPGADDEASFFLELQTELANQNGYLKEAIRILLAKLVPAYTPPDDWFFQLVVDREDEFFIFTNLDFQAINYALANAEISGIIITPEFLVCNILDASVDMQIASFYMAEIITSRYSSDLIRLRMAGLLKKRNSNLARMELFQTTLLQGPRAVGDAIRSGEKGFTEFIPVLKKATKFKSWLRVQNPDANLLSEYIKASTAETWVDRLPMKTVRYVTFNMLGQLSDWLLQMRGLPPVGSIAIGSFDSFVVDQVIKGWRPNQFIDGPLRSFVSGDN